MDKVSVMRCGSYDENVLDRIIENQFREFEKEKTIIKPGDKTVIKPNLIMRRRPEDASTTHPNFVGAIIRAVKRRGGIPIIAESPGGIYTKAYLSSVYSGTGIAGTAKQEGAELNFDTGHVSVGTDGGRKVKAFEIINPVVQADVVISAAKLKTHEQMSYSGAAKNLFGCVPGLMKPEFHYRFPDKADFASMLVDLCQTIKPSISFIDGIVGMEGNGPTGGAPKKAGLVFASTNPFAADMAAVSAIGFDTDTVPLLAEAVKRGLCPKDLSGLEISGDGAGIKVKFKAPDAISLDFFDFLPDFLKKRLDNLLSPYPVISSGKCVGCGKCAQSCPRHTISIRGRKARIDYSNCIRCFCCHEMCPEKAVRIRRFRLFGKGN